MTKPFDDDEADRTAVSGPREARDDTQPVGRDQAPTRPVRTADLVPNLGARAGIRDLRDTLQHGPRLQPLDARTISLRISDPDIQEVPAATPLGQAPSTPPARARMTVFFGAKGGVGATALAVNVGGLLARMGQPTVLVDMDLQLGTVPVFLDLRPERSLASLVEEAERLGEGPLQSPLDRHETGLRVVSQPRIEELGAITIGRLPRFFDALALAHPQILVDGLRDFNDHAVATMDLAHQIVLVLTQDVPAVRAGSRALRLFRRLGYPTEKLTVVVNRFHKRAPVSLEAIGRALGLPVTARVHNDFPLIEQALNQGKLVGDLKPRAQPARDLDALARKVAGMPRAPRTGLLGRLLRS
ncbi:MAG: hypothetical protein KC620_01305 [Myxococcales bacterium]|nr:hypothetical protein [Myxococcales bacterium]